MAVLAALGLLTSLWLPALAGTGSGAASAGCVDHLRQLAQALLLYAEDHSGVLPRNVDDAASYNWVPGSAGSGGALEFRPEELREPRTSHLADYLGRRAEPFRCPADARVGLYQGTNTAWKGWKVPASRSYSLNTAIGTQQDGVTPVDAPWLDGQHFNRRNLPYRTYGRLSDMIEPPPSALLAFLGEDPGSLNDGNFMTTAAGSRWVDFPETHHQFGGGVSFADGHAVIHAWEDSRIQAVPPSLPTSVMRDCPDLAWLQRHSSARAR